MKNSIKQCGRQTLSLSKGFTAVELLITLFIAAAFLMSGYQLYNLIIKDGGETRAQIRASNVAYDYLQRYKSTATNPCTVQDPLTDKPIELDNLMDVTVTVAITCPFTANPYISKVLVTLKYGSPQLTVSSGVFANAYYPASPTTLTATTGVSQILLNWTAPVENGGSPVTGYKIYRGTTSQGESLIATVGNELSYLSKGLTSETTYYYKVTAINNEGEGTFSNEASAIASTGASCLSIKNAAESTGDGIYWIKPSSTRFQVYCDMTTDGGGWVLVMQIAAAQSTTFGYQSTYWTTANTLNSAVPSSLTSIDAKYDTFNTFVTTDGYILLRAKNNTNYSRLTVPSMAGTTLLNRFTTLGGGASGTSPGTVLVAVGSQSPQELMGYAAPTVMCVTNPAKWRINFQNSHTGARLGNDVATNDLTTNNASSWPCYNGEGSNLSYSGVGGTQESADQWQDSYGSEALNRYRDNAGTGQGSHRGVSIFVR